MINCKEKLHDEYFEKVKIKTWETMYLDVDYEIYIFKEEFVQYNHPINFFKIHLKKEYELFKK